ncbi:hypothetical protein [uncultured Nocardioides sp.]|uniref:hypothetical protein n=1 Tax=uncultured Nocardioides sp. TaxID=198441 RepID=UPI00261F8744|nr:hypothetical protein [uncultured Nocardioides sp.]
MGVIGSLGGTVVGLCGGLVAQRISYHREALERLSVARRDSYLRWLTAVHGVFEVIASAHRALRRDELAEGDARREISGMTVADAQIRLEELRLVAGDEVASAAARIWRHMRRDRVALGHDLSAEAWRAWRDSYWNLRRAFLDAARVETGLGPLDWSASAVVEAQGKNRF